MGGVVGKGIKSYTCLQMDKLDLILQKLESIEKMLLPKPAGRKEFIPWQKKELMVREHKAWTISGPALSAKYGVALPTVYKILKTKPGREAYEKEFGTTEDIGKVNAWVSEQLKTYI